MHVFLFAVVECDVLASWTGITSNSTARTFDVVMEYACAQNYEFADGEQRKWSRCDVTGEWQPSITPCICETHSRITVLKQNKSCSFVCSASGNVARCDGGE